MYKMLHAIHAAVHMLCHVTQVVISLLSAQPECSLCYACPNDMLVVCTAVLHAKPALWLSNMGSDMIVQKLIACQTTALLLCPIRLSISSSGRLIAAADASGQVLLYGFLLYKNTLTRWDLVGKYRAHPGKHLLGT